VLGGGGSSTAEAKVIGGGGAKKPPVLGGGSGGGSGGAKKPPVLGGGSGGAKKPPVLGGGGSGGSKKPPVLGGGGSSVASGKKPANSGTGKGGKGKPPKPPAGPTTKPSADAKKKYGKSIADRSKTITNIGVVVAGNTLNGLAGVDPGGFALVIPNDPGAPDGSGLVASLDTDSAALPEGTDPDTSPGLKGDWQTARYLRLANATKGRLTARVLYETQNDKGETVWQPVRPKEGGDPLTVELDPGDVTNITDNDWTVQASRVRLWATSADNNEWGTFKDKDLWLVPETNDKGEHGYFSPQVESMTFTFR
jgi:hypothetical protein